MSTDIERISPQERIIEQVERPEFLKQLESALPETVSVRRFVRIARTAMLENPDITKCAPPSILRSLLRCAQDGLLPDGREAALIDFKGDCVYMPMIAGYVKVAAEFGWTLRSRAVYEHDEFAYVEEPPSIFHRPVRPGGERGSLIAAYATAKHRDGRHLQTVLHPEDIAKRRAVARSQNIWNKWEAQMWEKSAGRDLFRDIPFADSDRERITRILAADSTSGQSTTLLYGPSEDEGLNQPPTPDLSASAALAPGPQPGASEAGSAGGVPLKAPADPAHVEPEPSLNDGEKSQPLAIVDPAVLAAQAAAHYRPPNGQYRDLSFSEIQESGPKGEGWFAWALKTITTPPAYVQALRDYTRVYLPETYTRVMAEMEAS